MKTTCDHLHQMCNEAQKAAWTLPKDHPNRAQLDEIIERIKILKDTLDCDRGEDIAA